MLDASHSGRVALVAGFTAAVTGAAFAYHHRVLFVDWPAAAVDDPRMVLAYVTAGIAFQYGTPGLCLVAFIFGSPARSRWTARIGLACAAAAMVGYTLYVRACLDMIR